MTYTMVIRAETTSRLTFDNNAAASEKAACRGGGGAAAGVATRPGEPRLEALQVNQELGAHLLRVARRLRLEIGRRASSISRMLRVGVALRLPFVGGGSHSPPPRGRKSPRKESKSSSFSSSSSAKEGGRVEGILIGRLLAI